MNRIQSKSHRIGTYEIKISLSCFDGKTHIQNNGLAFGYKFYL